MARQQRPDAAGLAEQWRDELDRRFGLRFRTRTSEGIAAAASGNWFVETDRATARFDKLARSHDLTALHAGACRHDLVVCDEAHRMSASFTGGEVKFTRRYRLGQLLSGIARHFLLMTATPHNGKEEDLLYGIAERAGRAAEAHGANALVRSGPEMSRLAHDPSAGLQQRRRLA